MMSGDTRRPVRQSAVRWRGTRKKTPSLKDGYDTLGQEDVGRMAIRPKNMSGSRIMLQNTLINHVSLIVDKSGSMHKHSERVVSVFDRELDYLKQRSIDLKQETRVSIYLFDDEIEVLAFDMDVMRFSSLRSFYKIGGQTALIDATMESILDHRKLPELYGDHAFLHYLLTDGEENRSHLHFQTDLTKTLRTLPDNWTMAILVPDERGAREAQRFGFLSGSIATWDATQNNALEGVGEQFRSVVDNYMALRSSGVRGSKSLFTLDTSHLKVRGLQELPVKDYTIIPVREDSPIKEYVEDWTKEHYRLGSAYYQPTKPVVIQDHKNILIQRVKDGRVYEGRNLRSLLGLPDNTVKVTPGSHTDWRIFVQSTSVNRKLLRDTFVLVMN